jgi:uncharacterized membrane protein YoaK (UPF0700 family)
MSTRPIQQALTLIAIALTFASGAADVAGFTRLGNVFTSVMTGNIVLWGLAAARGSLTLFGHTAVSIAGYIAGVAEVSTTYLTGTLTGLVASLARPGQDTPHGLRRFGVLIGLAAGASLCGLLVATAADLVPVLPLGALVFTLGLGWRSGWPWPGSGRAAASGPRTGGGAEGSGGAGGR